MNKKKLIISIMALLFFAIGTLYTNPWSVDVYAETYWTEDDVFEYAILEDGTVEIIGYYAYDSEVIIPEEIDGKKVTSIGREVFYWNQNITDIEIPDSVTNIESFAFMCCIGITNLEIPDSVTNIGENAFENIANVSYEGSAVGSPWGARTINGYIEGNMVYENEDKTILSACIASVTGVIELPATVTEIDNDAFFYCDKITEVRLQEGVTTIGDMAFHECTALTDIELPESLEYIGSASFYDCVSLCGIEVPVGVTYIVTDAFERVANVIYNGSAEGSPWNARAHNGYVEDGLVYESSAKQELLACYSNVTGNVILPESVTSIGAYAFFNCVDVTGVVIPDGVASIGSYAFGVCEKLESIKLPENITTIADNTFFHCKGLKSVEIPDSVTSIETQAFFFCENLAQIELPSRLTFIGVAAFTSCSQLTEVKLPEQLNIISGNAFTNCNKLTEIEIPESVTSLGDYAFAICTSLTKIKIPASVTSIGEWAFTLDDALTVYCEKDSVAHTYAVDNSIAYRLCTDELTVSEITSVKNSGLKNVIKWNAVDGADGYEVYRSSNLYEDNVYIVEGGTVTSFTDSYNIIPNGEYTYTVVAYVLEDGEKIYGLSSDSQSVTAILPKATVTTRSTANGVNVVKWKAVEGATGYVIMRKSLKSAAWDEHAVIEGSSVVRYEDVSVSADSRYYYTVKAFYHDELSGEIIYAEYDGDNTGVIASVGMVSLTDLTTEAGANTIKWEPIAGVQGYVIKRKTDGGKWINLAVLKGANRCEYVDSKAIYAGSEYTYTIFAMGKKKADGSKNYGGFDKDGLTVTASVKTVSLKSVYTLSGKNVIKWNKVNGADGYVVMRKADGAAKWTTLKTLKGQNVVRYDDSSIKAGTKYTYTVRAYYTDTGNNKVYGDYNATGKSVIAK